MCSTRHNTNSHSKRYALISNYKSKEIGQTRRCPLLRSGNQGREPLGRKRPGRVRWGFLKPAFSPAHPNLLEKVRCFNAGKNLTHQSCVCHNMLK
jgi:hypothetical protein